jgi:hypothetical protein
MTQKMRQPKESEIELHPDAWERFTEFVKQIAKAGPQHREKKGAPNDRQRERKSTRGRSPDAKPSGSS